MNISEIITGLLNETIKPQTPAQEEIYDRLRIDYQNASASNGAYKESSEGDLYGWDEEGIEEWADSYGCDEYEEAIIADIEENF